MASADVIGRQIVSDMRETPIHIVSIGPVTLTRWWRRRIWTIVWLRRGGRNHIIVQIDVVIELVLKTNAFVFN